MFINLETLVWGFLCGCVHQTEFSVLIRCLWRFEQEQGCESPALRLLSTLTSGQGVCAIRSSPSHRTMGLCLAHGDGTQTRQPAELPKHSCLFVCASS